MTIVDLSSGRSAAVQTVLEATVDPQLEAWPARWLIFHRWTYQHILAANGLVHGDHGLLTVARKCRESEAAVREFSESIRYV